MNKIKAAINKDKYDEASDIFNDYKEWKKRSNNPVLTSDLEIYAVMASFYNDHLNFICAEKTYTHFFDIYEDVKSGKINTDDASAINFQFAVDKNYVVFLYSFIKCCVICNDYCTAMNYMTHLPVNKYSGNNNDVKTLIDCEFEAFNNVGYGDAVKCFQQHNEYGRNVFIAKLIAELASDERKSEIISALRAIGESVPWLCAKSRIFEDYYINDSLSEDRLREYCEKYGIMQDVDLIKMAMETQTDISFVFEASDFDMQKSVLLCRKHFLDFFRLAEEYKASENISPYHYNDAIKFYDCCISVMLMDNEDRSKEEKELLIAGLFKVKSEIKKKLDRVYFDRMAVSVKQNIRHSISSGNHEQARKTLAEYRQINPKDVEIEELEAMLEK